MRGGERRVKLRAQLAVSSWQLAVGCCDNVMRLSELVTASTSPDPVITGVTEDSRRIAPGMVFVAVPGSALDGHAFVEDAVARGAAAIVAERDLTAGVPIVRVGSARKALAELAARFHGNPARDLRLIGFTGTFGKTSTSDVLRQLLDAAGRRTAVLGSLGARYGSFARAGLGLTTPAPVELHAALRELREAGADTVIMEVTSHALRMERVYGLTFGGGLLAALMPGEHTDFHRTYDDYVNAKRLFLNYLAPDALLAYDADNRAARQLASEARVARTAGFSAIHAVAQAFRPAFAVGAITLDNVRLGSDGTHFSVHGVEMHSTLPGRGHLRNVGLALAYALSSGVPIEIARDVVARLVPLRRRMERYAIDGREILDDTAAHPESFKATFETADLIPHTRAAAVYAIRGSRGVDINVRNARALADLALVHGIAPLIVTASEGSAGPHDVVKGDERDAALDAIASRGQPYVFEPRLDAAARMMMEATAPGDLILLLGAQGMDKGREILSSVRTSS
jgi:UDP-N-acetylmuramoyl-L-alanyl-D-glutamate--2,6-diaminopimelate ligase